MTPTVGFSPSARHKTTVLDPVGMASDLGPE